MKRLLFLLFSFFAIHLQAQNRSNIWEFGNSTNLNYPNGEMRYIDGSMDTNSIFRIMSTFITNNSICDTDGDLLFYTNGITVGNRNYDTLENATNFNPGTATSFYDPPGMGICQGALIINDPGDIKRYYIFHETGEFFFANNISECQPLYLSFSVMDMSMDAGFGGIIDSLKNVHVIEDTLVWGGLTACKHANGRDWWVVAREYFTDKYFKLLITPDGISGPFVQHIGSQIKLDAVVQAAFSPDGSKYCFTNQGGWFDFMEFDRCTGKFSNAITLSSPDSLELFGNSFSPDGRFLYISSRYNLYQYDIWNTNLNNSVIHIAEWDSFTDYGTDVLFFMHQLAPDGRIYISAFNGVSYLNIISSPDSLGLLCDFEPHSYKLPAFSSNIPSFPNYDLDSLPGADTCNSIYTSHNIQSKAISTFRIQPNPVSDWLNIVYNTNEDAFFELTDIYGKRAAATSLFHYFKNRLINVSGLPAGVYFATVTQKGKRIWSEEVVIAR